MHAARQVVRGLAPKSAALGIVLCLACGGSGGDAGGPTGPGSGGSGTSTAPITLMPDNSAPRVGDLVHVVVRGGSVPSVGLTGTLDTARVTAVRLNDSTAVLFIPEVAPGTHTLTLTNSSSSGSGGSETGSITWTVESPIPVGDASAYLTAVIDTITATINGFAPAALPTSSAGQPLTSADSAKRAQDIAFFRRKTSEFQAKLSAVPSAQLLTVAHIVAANRATAQARRAALSAARLVYPTRDVLPLAAVGAHDVVLDGDPESYSDADASAAGAAAGLMVIDVSLAVGGVALAAASVPAVVAAAGAALAVWSACNAFTDMQLFGQLMAAKFARDVGAFTPASAHLPSDRVAASSASRWTQAVQAPARHAASVTNAAIPQAFVAEAPTPVVVYGLYRSVSVSDRGASGPPGQAAQLVDSAHVLWQQNTWADSLAEGPPILPAQGTEATYLVSPAFLAITGVTASSGGSVSYSVSNVTGFPVPLLTIHGDVAGDPQFTVNVQYSHAGTVLTASRPGILDHDVSLHDSPQVGTTHIDATGFCYIQHRVVSFSTDTAAIGGSDGTWIDPASGQVTGAATSATPFLTHWPIMPPQIITIENTGWAGVATPGTFWAFRGYYANKRTGQQRYLQTLWACLTP